MSGFIDFYSILLLFLYLFLYLATCWTILYTHHSGLCVRHFIKNKHAYLFIYLFICHYAQV